MCVLVVCSSSGTWNPNSCCCWYCLLDLGMFLLMRGFSATFFIFDYDVYVCFYQHSTNS